MSAKSQKRAEWSDEEINILIDRYKDGGYRACAGYVRGRSVTAIRQKARALGLRSDTQNNQKNDHTTELDAAIRRLYAQEEFGKGAMKRFCKARGVTRQYVYARAKVLGIVWERVTSRTPIKAPDWTAEEDEIVEDNAHMHLTTIARKLKRAGYKRTEVAIANRRQKLGIWYSQARIDAGIYTAKDVAYSMGVDQHSVTKWIKSHGLPAKPIGDGRLPGTPFRYEIKRDDLRKWMLSCNIWDHRRCNRIWLVDILSNGSLIISSAG